MRKQFLWTRRPGFHYFAPGNINISAGDRGSVSLWYHPERFLPRAKLWRVEIDEANFADLSWTEHWGGHLQFTISSEGTLYHARISELTDVAGPHWWLITATWDFTTPDAGELHLYADEQSEDTTPTTVNAPVGLAEKFYLGNRLSDYLRSCCFDHVLILDEVMSQSDHLARLDGADSILARRYTRRGSSEVPGFDGNLLFHADFNGTFDARIASGDGTAYWDVSEDEYDEFALIDDGSRHLGRRLLLPLGLPAQDNRDDDRLPGQAVVEQLTMHDAGDCTTIENDPDCSRIIISDAPSSTYGEGRGWLLPWFQPDDMKGPVTLRMRVNIPHATNPVKYWTALGPLAYYNGGRHGGVFGDWATGHRALVVDDAGNTATSFKTTLGDSDEWVDAELSVITGNCAPARLHIADYNPTTGVVTVDGALSDIPEPDSVIVADHRGRICSFDGDGVYETQNMEAWLWEEYGDDRPWIELECQQDDEGFLPAVRYQRGRTSWMQFTMQRCNSAGSGGMMFGKSGSFGPNEGYSAEIRLESIEVDGPGTYQLLQASDSRYGRACAPRDNFMNLDPETGHSTRIWRAEGVSWEFSRPTKFADPAQAAADLSEPGTWRDTATLSSVVMPRDTDETVIGLVQGTDPDGVERLGYCIGYFDGQRMTWEDETPPPGSSNPFLDVEQLRPRARSDSEFSGTSGPSSARVLGTPNGSWALVYGGSELHPDYYLTHMLYGAEDRWSFSYEEQFWPENPLCPGIGGVDKIPPEYSGINLWANRDSHYGIVYNEYAKDPDERYLGYARGKTICPGPDIGMNIRPLIGFRSPDLKTFFPLPHGNTVSPLPSPQVHSSVPYIPGPDTVGILVEFLGGDLRLFTSEDGIHFQKLTGSFLKAGELPEEGSSLGPGTTFRIGDYRIYYYTSDGMVNYAYVKADRETHYVLDAEATTGYIETPIVQQPEDGWENLWLNVNPRGGQVRVAVIDPADESIVAGYGFDDCDPVYDGVRERISWQGARFSELTHEHLRLRFEFQRPDTEAESPELYLWEVAGDPESARPSASNPQVEEETNPANVTDAAPEFSWDYSDPNGVEQSAYHILVASSQTLLDANEGDLWDSGPVSGDETTVEYDGETLDELTTYVWKVRVRNAEGVWSEEW